MVTTHTPSSLIGRVAVVTVSYGSEKVLGPFLASLEQGTNLSPQVIVVDNKSAGTGDEVAIITTAAGAEYLPLATNRGYGHAVNEAVRNLSPQVDWVVISNPDVTVNPGSIDLLLATADADATIAAVGPCILTADGQVYPSARSIPSLRSGIGHAIFANLWPSNPWSRRYRKANDVHLSQRDAGWLSGAFLVVRRSVFDELAGFDESYFMYFEDVDLGYRIGKLGLRNVYQPNAAVVHTGAHSTSTKDESARMIRAHHKSAQKFLSKKYSGPFFVPVRVALAIGLGIRSQLEAIRTKR